MCRKADILARKFIDKKAQKNKAILLVNVRQRIINHFSLISETPTRFSQIKPF